MTKWLKVTLFALAGVAASQGLALAQTSSIAGVVRDTSGGVMPGVTVEASSPALIEKTRTAVTDSDGQYKIIDLNPGTYTVTFSLEGFSTVRREGVELTGDFTAAINAELKVGTLAETITVSGQSPLIDTQTVQQRKSLTSDLIDGIPTGRSFQALSVLVPGVTISLGTQDVGGTGGERYQTLTVHGSRSDQMPLVMNGMPYNNMNNTGGGYNTTLVQNTGTVQEMTITTSALSSEWRTSGVLTNTIPKEGGNTFRGYFFGNFANHDFQSNNLTSDLISQGLTHVNSVYKIWDVNPAVGGPIAKDRLWFYGGFRFSGAENYIAGMYQNLRPGAPQYCNTAAGCTYGDVNHPTTLVPNNQDVNNPAIGGDTWTRGETLNLTLQASQKNKITMYGHFNQRLVDCNGCAATLSPEAGVYFTHRPEYILQSTWTNPYTNKLLFEGGFTFYNERWIFGPEPYNVNGYGPDAVISKTESTLGVTYGAGNVFTTAYNHQYNMRAAVNYVTGSHAFKFGTTDMWGTRQYSYDTNQAQAWVFSKGIPDDHHRIRAAADRPRASQGGARPLRSGSLDDQTSDPQLRGAFRLPQRVRAGPDGRADPVRGCASVQRDREHSRLEGHLAAGWRCVRRVRHRQDRGPRQLGTVPRQRVDQHGDAQQSAQHVGEPGFADMDGHERQLRAGLQPPEPRAKR
jgi:hypothetical protein